MSSQASNYITTIANLIKTIAFDGGTLDSKGLIYKYEKSKIEHQTEVHVFRDNLETKSMDNVDNIRTHYIIISIVTIADNRESAAQEDIYYLEEKILEKIEQNLSNIGWFFMNNYQVQARNRKFLDNYFVKDIPIEINEIVTTY